MFAVGLIAAFFWGAGTNFLDERWYPIHGISVGDLLFVAWLGLAVFEPDLRAQLMRVAGAYREHLTLMTTFVVLLFTSLAVNAFRYGAGWADIFAIMRLLYFSALVVFTTAFVQRYGAAAILASFLLGIACLTIGRLDHARTFWTPTIIGLPVLKDPNVIGNLLGVGTLLSSVAVLLGSLFWPLSLAIGFAAASVMTFSKGAWLMVTVGLGANVAAILMQPPLSGKNMRRMLPAAALFVIVLSVLIARRADQLQQLWEFKLQSTEDIGTVGDRYAFAIAGLYAMFDHPVFGVGFRNYDVTYNLYREIMPEPSDNAHNVFVQIGAVGGIPALVVFLILFAYPFVDLWRALRPRRMPLLAAAYVATAVVVFGISGSVQLQLMAQPFFWFFTGLVKAFRWQATEAAARLAA